MDFTQDSKIPRVLIAFLLLGNVLFLPITGDEAYYFTWSRDLAWGFYDHPPLVAWVGSMAPKVLYRALFTVIALSIVFRSDQRVYWALAAPGAHLFLGAAVPDTILVVVGLIAIYVFKHWHHRPAFWLSILLGVVFGILGLTKYHGVLLAVALFLGHPQVLTRGSLLVVVAVASAILLPYFHWLYTHDWVSFQYHLSGRYVESGGVSGLLVFLGLSCILWWPIFFSASKLPRWSIVLSISSLSLFGWAAFRGSVEYHWLLVFIWIIPELELPKKVIGVGAMVLVVSHAVLWIPGVRTVLELDEHYRLELATLPTSEVPTVFIDQYQDAALYSWYTNERSYVLAHPGIRLSQYSLNQPPFEGRVRILNRLGMGQELPGTPFHRIEQELVDLQHVEVEIKDDRTLSTHQDIPEGFNWIVYSYVDKIEVGRINLGSGSGSPKIPAHGEGVDQFLTLEKNWVPSQLWVKIP